MIIRAKLKLQNKFIIFKNRKLFKNHKKCWWIIIYSRRFSIIQQS